MKYLGSEQTIKLLKGYGGIMGMYHMVLSNFYRVFKLRIMISSTKIEIYFSKVLDEHALGSPASSTLCFSKSWGLTLLSLALFPR